MKVERIMTNRIKRTKTKAKCLPNPPTALICNHSFQPTDLITIDPLNNANTGQNDVTLLNYETDGKDDNQQYKDYQDKCEMTTKSSNKAHSNSLLSTILQYYIFLFRKCLGNCYIKKSNFYPQHRKLDFSIV
jgi:hypothetical protein